MRSEKSSAYYDEHLGNDAGYHVHYRKSFYYVHWTQVIVFLNKIPEAKILEIGCGTGQLAEYLHDENLTTGYRGFDFSPQAVTIAQQRVTLDFYVGNALDKENYRGQFNTVVCLEVLEHISKDLEVLSLIPEQTNIIFSVPNFDAPSHVRWFTSERQIKKRYFRYVNIREIVRIGNIYICRGKVSRFKPNLLQRLLATREQIGIGSFTKRLRHHVKNLLKLKD